MLVKAEVASILERKRQANAYLPRLAEGYVRGEIDIDGLVRYFGSVAHLYTVGIDVNAICNLSCRYCYLDKYNRSTVPKYIPLDPLYAFISDVITAGVDLIAIVGKEPFADDRGIKVLQRLDLHRKTGAAFRYGVVTNGTLVSRYLDEIPNSISYLDISLDGDRAVTDRMRGYGVFDKAVQTIKTLTERGHDTWVSSVVYAETTSPAATLSFMQKIAETTGCKQFYFSPVRNFTGELTPFLLSFCDIMRFQRELADLSARVGTIHRVILDHPYEAVWRDYFGAFGSGSSLGNLMIDGYGNILRQLSNNCFQKLDVFPHGPWGTCRVDARGEFLHDVESRTFENPSSVGNIQDLSVTKLHRRALNAHLRPMLSKFLRNMVVNLQLSGHQIALTDVSVPL